MRHIITVGTACLAALLACEPATEPLEAGSGGMDLRVTASGSAVALDSGRVHIDGPTDKTVSATPGSEVTVTGLLPGAYTVSLEGFVGGEVTRFGQVSGVQVVAGQNTATNVTLAEFQPGLAPFSPDFAIGKEFTVSFSGVAGAASFRVEVASNNSFTGALITVNTTGTSAPVTVSSYGVFFVRVRGIDPFGAIGVASAVQSITTVPPIVPLISCLDGSPGDRIDRGFYVPSFPGVSLVQVDLFLSSSTLGTYTFDLTARSGTFDGSVIGIGTATVDLGSGEVQTAFEFSNAVVTEASTVTFAITQVGGPSDIVFYSVPVDNPSCPVIQTNGTEPPLSTMRRNGVKVVIQGGQP